MGQVFARGKWSFGICDRCGERLEYKDMVWDNATETKALRVHRACQDKLDPFIAVARINQNRTDAVTVRYPRPRRNSLVESIWDGGGSIWDLGTSHWDVDE